MIGCFGIGAQGQMSHDQGLRLWKKFFVVGTESVPSYPVPSTQYLLQMLKQIAAQQLGRPEGAPFWQPRYYDFNVWSEAKRVQKLRYIHRNPVKRGLVDRPEDWWWSSFCHYATGAEGPVELESQ